MNRIKVFSFLLVILFLVSPLFSSVTTPVFAQTTGPEKLDSQVLIRRLELARQNAFEAWESFSPEEQKELIKALRLDADNKQGEIIAVIIVPTQSIRSRFTKLPEVTPDWWCNCYEIRNISGPSAYNQVPAVAIAQGWGPGTLTLSTTKSVSNKWSAEGGVSAEVVSAKVGFDVTLTSSWTYSYQVNIPAGQLWEIDAYNYYYHYTFDVFYNPFIGDPYRVGSGWADEFKGVTYVVRRLR